MTSSVIPAEWGHHRSIWLGYPSHPELWEADLDAAREEVGALAHALAGPGGEAVQLLVFGDEARRAAESEFRGAAGIAIVQAPFGDIWLRDTGPIFTAGAERRAHAFTWNGWGGKYLLEHDDEVAPLLAETSGFDLVRHAFVLEGGAVEHDGRGTVLTTRQCVLNDNRNEGWDEAQAEAHLGAALGARKVLWLDEGLLHDHTDGHVDNVARFVAPSVVACQAAWGDDDPNARVHRDVAAALASMTDAEGDPLRVVPIPSPGRVVDAGGAVVPASHMNFVIANRAVILPAYGEAAGRAAAEAIRPHVGGRKVIVLPSSVILTGGGSFHCITQQVPV